MYYFFIFVLSTIICYFSTFFAKKMAFVTGAIDRPNEIKIHHEPMPRLGGLAFYIAFVFSFLILYYYLNIITYIQFSGIITGISIVFIVGLLDDIYTLKASHKLLFQAIAASVLFYYGFRIRFFPNYFISYLFTIIYVVGAYSAIDMIDGMDGLASGITFICSIFFLIIFWQKSEMLGIFISIILIGSSLGFLVHNWHPAKIFMGDGGTMLLGFLLATLMLMYTSEPYGIVSFIVPILILGIPIADNLITFIHRYKNGKSFLAGDLNHFYNRLRNCGFSYKKTIILMYIGSIVFGVNALLILENIFAGITFMVIIMILLLYYISRINIMEKNILNKRKE